MEGLTVNEMIETVGNIGAFALVAWLVRHTFQHTIPRLAKDFREELASQRAQFVTELGETRANFREELREERLLFADKLDRLTDEVHGLAANCRLHIASDRVEEEDEADDV